MASRRQFIGAISLPLGAPAVASALMGWRERAVPSLADLAHDDDPEALAADEAYWADVQRAFPLDRSQINLNNGGVSPAPAYVLDSMRRHYDLANTCPAYVLWQVQLQQREGVRERLARQWGVDPEEIAITRNASEGLEICQLGFDLEPGDEILTTDQDYWRMQSAFDQRARRDRAVINRIKIPVPCENDDEIVHRFEQAITTRTRLILMCHVINLTGQILPVKRVVAMARTRNVPVIVDGAHGLAQFPFKISDLDCDYYATSLHKWLFAPHGTGLLYVRRDKIAPLWPLMPAVEAKTDDIRKFEETGTRPEAGALAIAEALTFNQTIGFEAKAARLRHLRDAWAEPLSGNDRVTFHSSVKPAHSCAIATIGVEGVEPHALTNYLWQNHHILVAAIVHEDFQGIRVSPSVYTTQEELARFVDFIEAVIRKGLT
jgi:selenocysteine lyase/cysteine desulfurase